MTNALNQRNGVPFFQRPTLANLGNFFSMSDQHFKIQIVIVKDRKGMKIDMRMYMPAVVLNC